MWKKLLIAILVVVILAGSLIGCYYGIPGFKKWTNEHIFKVNAEEEKTDSNEDILASLEELKASLSALTKERDELKVQVDVQVKNYNEVSEKLKESQKKEADLQVVVTQYQGTIAEQEQKIIEHEQTITQKQTQIEQVIKEKTVVEERVKLLETQSSSDQEEINRLKAKVSDLERQLSEKEEEITQLEEENAQLRGQIATLQGQLAEKEQALKEAQENSNQLNIQIEILNQNIVQLNSRIAELEEALNRDEDKTYLADLLLKYRLSFVELDDNKFLGWSEGGSIYGCFNGIIELNTIDYSYKFVYGQDENNLYQLQAIKLKNNDIIFCGYYYNGLLIYNPEDGSFNKILDEYNNFYYYDFDDGNLMFSSSYKAFLYDSINRRVIKTFETSADGTWLNEAMVLYNDNILFTGGRYSGDLLLYKKDTQELKDIIVENDYSIYFTTLLDCKDNYVFIIKQVNGQKHLLVYNQKDDSLNEIDVSEFESGADPYINDGDYILKNEYGFILSSDTSNYRLLLIDYKNYTIKNVLDLKDIVYPYGYSYTLYDHISYADFCISDIDKHYYFIYSTQQLVEEEPQFTYQVSASSYHQKSSPGLNLNAPWELGENTNTGTDIQFAEFEASDGQEVSFTYTAREYSPKRTKILKIELEDGTSVEFNEEHQQHLPTGDVYQVKFTLNETILQAFKSIGSNTMQLNIKIYWTLGE